MAYPGLCCLPQCTAGNGPQYVGVDSPVRGKCIVILTRFCSRSSLRGRMSDEVLVRYATSTRRLVVVHARLTCVIPEMDGECLRSVVGRVLSQTHMNHSPMIPRCSDGAVASCSDHLFKRNRSAGSQKPPARVEGRTRPSFPPCASHSQVSCATAAVSDAAVCGCASRISACCRLRALWMTAM